MQLTRIQRFLTKTDLGISGKNGAEFLLDNKTNIYFKNIKIDQRIEVINIKDNSVLQLTKKSEASEKFTGPNLKYFFDKNNVNEGDIFEFIILEDDDSTYNYYINIIHTNSLIFTRKKNNQFVSLSESKLNAFLQQNKYNESSFHFNDHDTSIDFTQTSDIKLREDARAPTKHYQINNINCDQFIINLDTNEITELKSTNNVIEVNDSQLKNRSIDLKKLKINKDFNSIFEYNNQTRTITSSIRPSARIINAIGKDLIKDVYAAIIELVKNAYDADSKSVDIVINYDKDKKLLKTIVKDYGHGMTLDTILDIWLVPATSDKLLRRKSPNGRVLQGKKGIGRYAAGILGDMLLMESTDDNNNLSNIVIDFKALAEAKYLSDVDILIETGNKNYKSGVTMEMTYSDISEDMTVEIWNSFQLGKLETELKKLKSPLIKNTEDVFEINLYYKNLPQINSKSTELNKKYTYLNSHQVIEPLPIVDYFDYRVYGTVDSNGKGIFHYINQNIEKINEEIIEIQINLDSNQKYCGNVKFDYRVFDRDSESIGRLIERGLNDFSIGKLEAKKLLDSMYGIGIYRDIFRIRPYGNQDYDWLDLDKARVQNPSFAIGMNQIIGFIEIEGESNSNLLEKSARDGLIENSHYFGLQHLAKYILVNILQPKRFEFRQKTGRGRKPKNINEKIDSLFDFDNIEIKVKSLGLSTHNEEKILSIIKEERKSKEKDLVDIKDTIAVYQAQVTLGKMTDVLLHEGRKSLRYLNEQLPRINKWNNEYLNSPTIELKEQIIDRSLKTVSHAKDLSNLFKRIEPFSIGRLPNKKGTNIYNSIEKASTVYELKFKEENIIFINNIDKNLEIFGREYDIYTAFVNFLENSIYWLGKSKTVNKKITLSSEENEQSILIEMNDNGPGISKEYANLVFEPGFSLKEAGTGLGMSISAEALKRSAGTVSIGESTNGTILYIEFKKVIMNEDH